jgi:hypothetical protein
MATEYPTPFVDPESGIRIERIYGLMADFEDPEALIRAINRAYQSGYRRIDAYTPFPVEGLDEALRMGPNRLPLIVLGGGLLGAVGSFGLQYYASVIDYPMNVGGRPLNSWPAFIPITFEVAVLLAAFAAFLGMFILNGLPQPYHPVFNVENFELASRSHFFLSIESQDPKFDIEETRAFLKSLNPGTVSVIEY